MFKILFGLVAALFFCVQAHAAFPATPGACQSNCYEYQVYNQSGVYVRDPVVACAPTLNTYPSLVWDSFFPPNVCVLRDPNNGNTLGVTIVRRSAGPDPYTCPANATLTGTTCSCNSGFAESGSSCVASTPDCPFGQGRTFNRTEGWARSSNPDADDLVVDHGAPGFYGYNDGVCVGDIAKVERCFRSQEPSPQGLYRTSCDYTMVVSGVATESGDSAADPETVNASCPGVVGTVNGKPLCVGNASNPLPSPSDAPNHPTSAGNPSAGVKPATGEGSGSTGAGRTPTEGSGGNDGGPAGAANGRGGSGQRGEPGEDGIAVCGAPPLPACNVKVDETGTPGAADADSRFTQANTDLGKVQTDAQDAFGDHRDITLPAWSWTFMFPTGCTPLVLPAFGDLEIDVCQWQPMIHDLMSVIWVIAGIWGLIHLFMRATGV